jgi:hypothetical protein
MANDEPIAAPTEGVNKVPLERAARIGTTGPAQVRCPRALGEGARVRVHSIAGGGAVVVRSSTRCSSTPSARREIPMRSGIPWCAALVVAVGGCAGMGGGSKDTSNPGAQKIETPQQQSEQALRQASDAQKKASEQQKRAAEAGTAQAQRSQQQASTALSQQSARSQHGEHQLQGQISQATANELIVQTQGGQSMTFDVTSDTRIRIDGREATMQQIQPGENALVSYEVSGTQPTARVVQISTGNPAPSSATTPAP